MLLLANDWLLVSLLGYYCHLISKLNTISGVALRARLWSFTCALQSPRLSWLLLVALFHLRCRKTSNLCIEGTVSRGGGRGQRWVVTYVFYIFCTSESKPFVLSNRHLSRRGPKSGFKTCTWVRPVPKVRLGNHSTRCLLVKSCKWVLRLILNCLFEESRV